MSCDDLVTLQARPRPLNATVSRQMSAMPVRNSSVEVALRRELHRLGIRYRIHLRSLPGSPDIALTRAKIAVFVDGCFWHRCPDHGTAPKNNGAWWASKLEANVERDRRKDTELSALGWLSIHVWEHEDPVTAAEAIRDLWSARIN